MIRSLLPTHKHCSACQSTKPVDDFYRHPGTSDGYEGRCKDCKLTYTKSQYYQRQLTRGITPRIKNPQ